MPGVDRHDYGLSVGREAPAGGDEQSRGYQGTCHTTLSMTAIIGMLFSWMFLAQSPGPPLASAWHIQEEAKMKYSACLIAVAGALSLGACSSTGTGAVLGGAAGAATVGGAKGTLGGAAIGGIIGHEVGERREERRTERIYDRRDDRYRTGRYGNDPYGEDSYYRNDRYRSSRY